MRLEIFPCEEMRDVLLSGATIEFKGVDIPKEVE